MYDGAGIGRLPHTIVIVLAIGPGTEERVQV
jgi:hypothetical protein